MRHSFIKIFIYFAKDYSDNNSIIKLIMLIIDQFASVKSILVKSLILLFLSLNGVYPAFKAQADCHSAWDENNYGAEMIRIGVLANRGSELCLVEWGPTADYLSFHLAPLQFEIIPLDFDELIDAALDPESGLSYISANPSYYAYLEYHGMARRIATLQMPGFPQPQSEFGGVIFTRTDRADINQLGDLKGKYFSAVDEQSMGGWHAAQREIKRSGLSPEKHLASIRFEGTHDAVVLTVLSGQADAGTVRSTQLERMAAVGLINLDDIKIINDQHQQHPDYPYLLSTRLYPEWPFAALKGADDQLSKRIGLLLLMMDADHPAALALRSAGWTIPEQYDEVHNLLLELGHPPYEDYGITLKKTLAAYWPWLLAMLLLLIGTLGFGIVAFLLKQKAEKTASDLFKSEEKFKALFENAPVSVMIHDRHDLGVLDANRKALESYAVSSLEELQETEIWGPPPYDYEQAKALTKRAIDEGPQRFEWKVYNAKREHFWEDVVLQEIDFGDKVYLMSLGVNITDRKIAEDNLRRSENIFRNLFDNLSVGVAMISKGMQVLAVNPKMREWFPDNEYQNCPKCYHAFNYPAKESVCKGCPVVRTFDDGNIHKYERRVNTAQGERFVAITSTAITDADGQITAVIEMIDDITDRKETEHYLNEAKEKAEEANKAKSEFLANMSHEIRTPLNGVIGFTDLLKKTHLSETQKLYVENANTSAHSLLAIINDILDLSKIEADKLELEIIKTDIIALTEQAADIIKFHAASKNIELLLNIHPEVPRFAMVDPVRLKQILVNLLSNAVKFTEKGEVELRLTAKPHDDQRAGFSFSVRDTGIGISTEHQKRIFETFMQADTSTTRRYGGSGLGLPISGLLAQKMGSIIEVSSQLDKGSEFYFTIEAEYEKGEKLEPQDIKDIKRVLVVDDNDNNRLILQHTLEYWGMEFTGCENGKDAINIIKEQSAFDVIIMDYHMPGMNGLETIRIIRNELGLDAKKQPVILLHSSADDPTVFKECKKLGIRFSVTKPVKSQELMQYLKNLNVQSVNTTDKPIKKEKEESKETLLSQANPLILVVEDVEMNLLLIKTIIKKTLPGARFLEAYDGREAVKIYQSDDPDIIFMDVQMPIMDGLEATMAIRKLEEKTGKHTPIIALTARALKGESEKCIEAGMDDFLAKPINQSNLSNILKKYFS